MENKEKLSGKALSFSFLFHYIAVGNGENAYLNAEMILFFVTGKLNIYSLNLCYNEKAVK